MELIIKISNEMFDTFKKYGIMTFDNLDEYDRDMIADAIANGTSLPKGHGRLIEEPTETDISNTIGGDNDFAECIRDGVKAVFDNAMTVVEADKENKNGADN